MARTDPQRQGITDQRVVSNYIDEDRGTVTVRPELLRDSVRHGVQAASSLWRVWRPPNHYTTRIPFSNRKSSNPVRHSTYDLSHLHILKMMDSKTSTGPVAPTIVNGWPASNAYNKPQMAPATSISIVPCRQPQTSDSTGRKLINLFYFIRLPIQVYIYIFIMNSYAIQYGCILCRDFDINRARCSTQQICW